MANGSVAVQMAELLDEVNKDVEKSAFFFGEMVYYICD